MHQTSVEDKKPVMACGMEDRSRDGLKTDADTVCDDSSTEALKRREEAERWSTENPGAWSEAVSLALREAESERRFSMRWVADCVRQKEHTALDGSSTRLSNNLLPALSRLLLEEYPHVKPYIELRRAACDSAFGEQRA